MVLGGLYVLVTVVITGAPINSLGAIFVGEGETFYEAVHYTCVFVDAWIYILLGPIFLVFLRFWQGRYLWARYSGRSVVIVDTPMVYKLLRAYLSKMFSLAFRYALISVWGQDGLDHFVHEFTHLTNNDTLIALGRPDGRLATSASAEQASVLALQQAKFRSQGGIEAVTLGHSTWTIPNMARCHITIPSSRPTFVSEEMIPNVGHVSPGDALMALGNVFSSDKDKPVAANEKKPRPDLTMEAASLFDDIALEAVEAISPSPTEMGAIEWKQLLETVANGAGYSVTSETQSVSSLSNYSSSSNDSQTSQSDDSDDASKSLKEVLAMMKDPDRFQSGSTATGFPIDSRTEVLAAYLSSAQKSQQLDNVTTNLKGSEGSDSTSSTASAIGAHHKLPNADGTPLAQMEIVERQYTLEQLTESRVTTTARLISFYVMFHAMAKPVSQLPLLHYPIDRTASRLRVASTPAPIRMASELSSCSASPVRSACAALARKARLELECDRMVLWLYGDDALKAEAIVGGGTSKEVSVSVQIGLPGFCLLTASPVNTTDASSHEHFSEELSQEVMGANYHVHSVLCVPVYAVSSSGDTKAIGVLEAVNKIKRAAFTEEDELTIEKVASDISAALEVTSQLELTANCTDHELWQGGVINQKEDSVAVPVWPSSFDLMMPEHELDRLFERYDIDESGTINTVEELKQICVNLFIRSNFRVDVKHLDVECDAISSSLEREPMALGDFKAWWSQRMVPHIRAASALPSLTPFPIR